MNQTYQAKGKEFLSYLLLFWIIMGAISSKSWLILDEIIDFHGGAIDLYLVLGRWGLACFRCLFGLGTLTWSAIMFTGIFLSMALVVQMHLFEIKTFASKFIYASLSLCSVVLIHYAKFTHHIDALAFSYLLCSLSAWILLCTRLNYCLQILLATLLLSVALGIYQIVAIYFATIVCVFLFRRAFVRRKLVSGKIIGALAISSLLACGMWYLIFQWTLTWSLDPVQRIFGAAYQSEVQSFSILKESPLSFQVVYTLNKLKKILIDASGFGSNGSWHYATGLIPLLYLSYQCAVRKLGILIKVQAVVFLVAVWLIPYAFCFLLTTSETILRAQLAVPTSIAALWTIAWLEWEEKTIPLLVKRAAFVVLCILIARFSYQATRFHQDLNLTAQQMINNLNVLESRRQEYSLRYGKELPMRLIYAYSDHQPAGTKDHWYDYYVHLMGFTHMSNWNESSLPLITKSMPLYPHYGSMLVHEDRVIIVKMPNPWNEQLHDKQNKAIFDHLRF